MRSEICTLFNDSAYCPALVPVNYPTYIHEHALRSATQDINVEWRTADE
jgi:hypothetical protein